MLKFFDKSTTMVYASVIPDHVKKMYSNLIESTIYDETQKTIVEEIFKTSTTTWLWASQSQET